MAPETVLVALEIGTPSMVTEASVPLDPEVRPSPVDGKCAGGA